MKLFIFDLDGTVCDTLEDIAYAVNLMLAEYSFPLFTKDEIKKKIGNGARILVKKSLPENKREDDCFLNSALEKYRNYYSEHCLDKVKVYDGLDSVLHTLSKHGKKLAVVTNKDLNHATSITEKLFPGVFCTVIGYDGTYPHKPDPSAVNHILKKYGISAEDAAFVGDSQVDVETGRNSRLLTVGVEWGFKGLDSYDKNRMPDIIVTAPQELYYL